MTVGRKNVLPILSLVDATDNNMRFTQEDYRNIETWLRQRAVKDTELQQADTITGKEMVAVVQDGENRLVRLYEIKDQINRTLVTDFVNVSDRSGNYRMTLLQAVSKVDMPKRVPGMVVTFADTDGCWRVVQFKGENVTQWFEEYKWNSLFGGAESSAVYFPDEEDITAHADGNRKFLKLKDRIYDEKVFSGKGRVILRKSFKGTEACSLDGEDHYRNVLTQEDFPYENTVYVVRYDFTIDGHLRMPDGCELLFEGGSLSGDIDLNGCRLNGMVGQEEDYLKDSTVDHWAKGQIEYRNGEIQYWTGSEWLAAGALSGNEYFSKQEITQMLGNNYYSKGDVYNKQEIDSKLEEYITEQELHQKLEELNQRLAGIEQRILTLDQIQTAINGGCDVNLKMPSNNDNKLSLPIWTGTQTEYDAIEPKVSGMTYNIIDE